MKECGGGGWGGEWEYSVAGRENNKYNTSTVSRGERECDAFWTQEFSQAGAL